MAQNTDIERLYNELVFIREQLSTGHDLSVTTNFESVASKSLLLAAASHFERRITEIILECARANGSAVALVNFVKNQGLSRKYHTMFDWDVSNLNKFFSLFGNEAKTQLSQTASEGELKEFAAAFIFINSERNRLVHQDYATFNLNTTSDEVWDRFKKASQFYDWLAFSLTDLFRPSSM